uniref:IQ motif containing M n=1 Tax=Jaculus jaculus TaxID=51337 RepID=A0A8C5NUY9_JACJA
SPASAYPCSPTLEFTKQDFLQTAKFVIAKHHEKINENKVQGTSVNVFKNKHQKMKSYKYVPFEVNKKETLDVIQEHRMALRHIPKEPLRSDYFEEPSELQIAVQENHVLNIKEKYQLIDPFTKENVKLSTIMTDIDSVSKRMENERKHHGKLSLCFQNISNQLELLGAIKLLYAWETQKLSRKLIVLFIFLVISNKLLCFIFRPKDVSKTDKLDSKVKRIGPHIEIFQVFQGRNRFIITKRVIKLITIIQGYIRGWLERKRIQRIMKKVLYHGPNLKAVMNMYRIVTRRVRHRLGLWKTRQIVNFSELEEWMDRKKFYETMFAKREDWQGLERSDLLKYFNECGHFPTQSQIDDCWELFHIGDPGRYSDMVKKPTAIEMLFTLYPPQGAKVRDNSRLRSTWLRPIVNGEEGYKYIVSGHPVLKRANIRIVGRLVANSVRERKMRQFFKS